MADRGVSVGTLAAAGMGTAGASLPGDLPGLSPVLPALAPAGALPPATFPALGPPLGAATAAAAAERAAAVDASLEGLAAVPAVLLAADGGAGPVPARKVAGRAVALTRRAALPVAGTWAVT